MNEMYPKSFGKYLLTKRIAVGGMAEVFKAKLLGVKGFEKTLAVKRILPEYSQDEEFVQMFVDEARISSNLHHKNIVQVFEFGEVNQQYYLTMEFINGCNLKNLFFRIIKQNKVLPRELIYYIILKTASALEYAHTVKMEGQLQSLQLVHRDVSPQNILISKMGDVKITDFGIAKAAIKLSQTQPGKIQGKYSYMSPEQALGRNITHKSDIFSLGIVFYELLTEKKVYGSAETIKRYSEATRASIPRIGTIIEDLPAQIDSLITRMVSKNPDDRPNDCSEVVNTLMEFLSSSSDETFSAQLGAIVEELFPEETMQTVVDRPAGASERSHIRVSGKTNLPDAIKSVVAGDSQAKPLWRWTKRLGIPALVLAFLFYLPSIYQHFKPVKTKPTKQENTSTTKEVDPNEKQKIQEEKIANAQEVKDMELQLNRLDDEIELVESELRKNTPSENTNIKEPETPNEISETTIPPTKKPKPEPQGCPEDMATIEGGEFFMGSNDSERNELIEAPAFKQNVKKFCIDRYEFPNHRNSLPSKNINLAEARTSCENIQKRLCSDIEWERACKGPWTQVLNQQYPYGGTWKPGACNVKSANSLTDEDHVENLAESGDFPECATAEGVQDMTGNAMEWTDSKTSNSSKSILKGGSFKTPKFQARCSSLREESPTTKQPDIGFRCCKDIL